MSKSKVSGIIHLVGAILSIVALVILICSAVETATVWHVVSFSIFGASMIMLYSASTTYHFLPEGSNARRFARHIDHMMIFLLIAGTYTPICLVTLRGPWGWSILISVWAITIAGMLMKAFWLDAPRWISTALYIFVGWIIVIAMYPLVQRLPIGAIIWLALGGIFYTIGGVIYGLKRPNFSLKFFGFHEFFHLFVVAGSVCHFLMMYLYILQSNVR